MWLPQWLSGKESACNAGAAGRNRFDPWVRKILWKRAWQYSCLENAMDRGVWQTIVHGVAKIRHVLALNVRIS